MASESETKVYPCRGIDNGCLSSFKFRNDRLSHEKTCRHFRVWKSEQPRMVHSEDGRIKCSRCSTSYSEKTAFFRHKKNCDKYIAIQLERDNPSPNKLRCESCGKVFLTKRKLSRHLASVHGVRQGQVLICPGCSAGYMRRNHFENHLLSCRHYKRMMRCSDSSAKEATTSNNDTEDHVEKGVSQEPEHLTVPSSILDSEPKSMASQIEATKCSAGKISQQQSTHLAPSGITQALIGNPRIIAKSYNFKAYPNNIPVINVKANKTPSNQNGHCSKEIKFISGGQDFLKKGRNAPCKSKTNEFMESAQEATNTATLEKEVRELKNMMESEIQQHAKIGKLFLGHLKQLRRSNDDSTSEESGNFNPEFLSELDKVFGTDVVKDQNLLEFIVRETAGDTGE